MGFEVGIELNDQDENEVDESYNGHYAEILKGIYVFNQRYRKDHKESCRKSLDNLKVSCIACYFTCSTFIKTSKLG